MRDFRLGSTAGLTALLKLQVVVRIEKLKNDADDLDVLGSIRRLMVSTRS